MGLLVPVLVGIGVLIVLARRRPPLPRAVGACVSFGVLVLVALSPWYTRNLVETGDPLYPFGVRVFAGRNWSVAAGDYLELYYSQYRTVEAAKRQEKPYEGFELVWFPWDFTMHPASFENAGRQALDVSPVVLAFLPAVLLVRRRRAATLAIAAIGVAYIAIIAGGAWAHPRYVFVGIALAFAAAIPAARALCGRRVFAVALGLTLAGNLALLTRMQRAMWFDQVRVALGRMTADAFLARYEDRWVFWQQANRAIPPVGRVVVLEKIPHPYYIERPFVLLSYLEQGLVDYRRIDTVSALDAALHQLGASHVVVDEHGLEAADDPFEARVTALWRAFVAQLGAPVVHAGGYALYRLPTPVTLAESPHA